MSDWKKKMALSVLKGAGAKKLKGMIKDGPTVYEGRKYGKDEPVDLQYEVDKMRSTLLANDKSATGMVTLGITDNDLEEVIRDICKKVGLKIKGE